MPTTVQFRRGTTTQNNNFTGASGELTVDTTLNVLRVHDGATPGGYSMLTATATQTLSNKTLASPVITGTITAGASTGTSGQYLSSTGTGVQWVTLDSSTISNGTSSMSVIASGGNIRANVGGATIISITSAGIINGQANGVGNIGNATNYFNTVFAKSTSAQYADVAEKYLADEPYPVGTVLVIGGKKEVTQSTTTCQTSVAGTVSENPGVLMNRGLEGEYAVAVALIGRVPCKVKGKIAKGDLLMTSNVPGTACKLDLYQPGCVIGKALESHNSDGEGTIEIMVGRL